MCELCTRHGEGKVWYRNVRNYSADLVSDLARRRYIENFFESTIQEGFFALGRLETLFNKGRRLPPAITEKITAKARREHFGQVLLIEEIRGVVRLADTIVRMPCACRWVAQKEEKRCCFGVSCSAEPWYRGLDMGYFGKAPSEGLEPVSKEEAIRQMEGLEDEGAIHTIWTMLTPFIGAICNCTVRDCLGLRTLRSIRVETIARAEHVARVEGAVCSGCGLCSGLCQFDAVTSRCLEGRTVARIDPQRCFGCGLCARGCPQGAVSLVDRW